MISSKELGYVSEFARYAPFPGINYAINVMDELIKAYELYKTIYMDKEFSLIFSNGEEIEYAILRKNLAHMLGVDFKNLMSEPMKDTLENVLGITEYNQRNSFEVLKKIIERAEEVVKNDSDPNKFKILNYYKSMIKCAIFCQFSSFDKFNFGCINFDREKYNEITKGEFFPQSTKLFFTRSNEALIPYFMMGIKYDELDKKYIPETLFATESFKKFFINQELILPIQILICDNNDISRNIASNEEKLNLLNMYKFIINTYKTSSTINIFSDYESMLMSQKQGSVKIKVK